MAKIYISGPITGVDDYLANFEEAERRLKEQGYDDIVNPAIINLHLNPEHTTYEQYMKVALALLSICDTVYFLNGWEKSKGAVMEHIRAEEKEMKMLYEAQY